MGEFFGTDGIRGVAGERPLDRTTIELIGRSLAKVLTERLNRAPKIIIGRDTRESGEWIESSIIRGINSGAASSLSAGIITTPGVAYLTRKLEADAGLVISASHNPYQDNGIKVFAPTGKKLDDAAEQSIEKDLKAAESFGSSTGLDDDLTATAPPIADSSLKEEYLSFLRDEIGAGVQLEALKLVIDCANGASYELAPRLFSELGADLVIINAKPNGRNINLDCGSLHPERLQRAVIETKSDLGVAFDGDADRLLMVDENGMMVDGDQVLFIMAEYLASQNKLAGNRVVATIMSNLGLQLALEARGIAMARTSVGDKYVLDELLKGGGSIGGEQSGHIIFPEISLAGDGMITALEILRVITESKRSLGDLSRGFTRYPQITINVNVKRKPPLQALPVIQDAMEKIEQALNGEGRLLVRYSGTENKARVMIEGRDEADIRNKAESLAKLIGEELS